MITISRANAGFQVTFSGSGFRHRRVKVIARTIDEVHEAINHYYKEPHFSERPNHCPICREEQDDAEN